MKKYSFVVVALDDWGGSITQVVRAHHEEEAADVFDFMHAAENLEIVEVKNIDI